MAAKAPTRPTPMPASASTRPSRITGTSTCRGAAPERDADADLARALRHGEADQAEHADRRQHQREHGEDPDQHGAEARLLDRVVDDVLERRDVGERQVGVDRRELRLQQRRDGPGGQALRTVTLVNGSANCS